MIDDNPVTFKQVAEYYRLNPSTLSKAYKNNLSDYQKWNQKSHATQWTLHEENVGSYMSIDETSPSRGDLMTILSNKDGHGRKGTIVATVNGTKSEELCTVFSRIPEQKRKEVKEVTMDFSDSMYAAVSASFPNAEVVIDCFHVVQLATSALSEIRMNLKRQAMAADAEARREHKKKLKASADARDKRQAERVALGLNKSKRGRPAKRKNEAYVPPRFANGDTAAELLTRCKHFISQSRDKWTDSQKERAEILFEQYPTLLVGYNLVNQLRTIFKNKQHTPKTAAKELKKWYEDVELTDMKTLKNAAVTILSREEHVLNYFNNRHTNASAESLNAKIKGFRSLLRGVSDMTFFMYRLSTVFG